VKIVTVVGARPQFIKAAALSPEITRQGLHEVMVHTGQHYDYGMSQIFFDELKMRRPDHSLGVGSGTHAEQTAEMMKRLEPILDSERPDWVLIYGDTNSTLAASLVAAKLRLPIAHVEAGLRSFDKTMPEEINRVVADHLASLCFAPTSGAAVNLRREGIVGSVRVVGDLMVDLALSTAKNLPARPEVLRRLAVEPKQYAVATIHRAANTDNKDAFQRIMTGLRGLNFPVVLPAHPRIMQSLKQLHLSQPFHNVRICDPLSYTDLIALQVHARVVVTDSGGIQKEAYVLGTPCVTLRQETEWVETLTDGWNVLAGQDPEAIARTAARERPSGARQAFFGSGQTAGKIARILLETNTLAEHRSVG